jgi:hypothetical protein
LVGLWTFDGPDVTDKVYDRSGQGNNAYFYNGATSSAKTIGKLGQALKFDGNVTAVFGSPTFGSDYLSNDYTVSVWEKSIDDKSGNFHGLFGTAQGFGGQRMDVGLQFVVSTEAVCFYASLNNTTECYNDNAVADGHWHHIVATRNSVTGTETVYVDGSQLGQATGGNTGTLTYTDNNMLEIGAVDDDTTADPTAVLNGSIDDVRVYTRVLSPSEVQQLYLLGGTRIKN